MTVLTIPREVATECATKLLSLAATANRDAMTLINQAMALAKNEHVYWPLGILKKYVREHNQYGSGEVSEIIARIEAAADPKHIKCLARRQVKRDAYRADLEKRCSEPWHPPTHREAMAAREKAAKPCRNGNVISGPWDTAG